MSTEDGPGIRTTVFMKGCTLKCLWCHNPESISIHPQVQWIGSRCIGCKTCIAVCPNGALLMTASGIDLNRIVCQGCGMCAEACPTTAMELLGKAWNVSDLIDELLKDRAYFEKSDGGVTISGGEATLQTDFVSTLLKILSDKGIHTAIDTCGLTRKETLDLLLPYTDMVLYDLKEIDPQLHRRFTHSSNEQILDNLIYITKYMKDHEKPREIWIRTPLIPAATATDKNVMGIARFIAANCSEVVTRWDLLAFNNLCRDKYLRLGLDWQYRETELLTTEELERLAEVARNSAVNPAIVHWSGSTDIKRDEHNLDENTTSVQQAVKTVDVC